jgi:hypothetical protein
VILGYLDAAALFKTPLGGDVEQIVQSLLPLGPESNFSARRDVTRVYGGVYAMQGADFCAVVQGTFDVDAIHRAVGARAITVAGAPLVKSQYAGNDLYTAGNLGFTLLTPHTALTGNEIGMRRALDRLRRGKLERSIPPWMADLFQEKRASILAAGDLAGQPAVASASQTLPFLGGLKTLRALGNFEAPGVNLVGTLGYGDPQTAASAAAGLQNAHQMAQMFSIFAAFSGFSVPPLQLATKESDVAFTVPMSEGTARGLLHLAAEAAKKAITSTRTASMP